MRTTVIPAQVTTVEDKIAGSLNLTQIILLVIPVLWATAVYIIFPPAFKLHLYKVPTALIVLSVCLLLALRIKGKLLLNWLLILFKYNLRPKYYVFNKNASYLRQMCLPEYKDEKSKLKEFSEAAIKLFTFSFLKGNAKKVKATSNIFEVKDLASLKSFIYNPDYSLSLKPDSKGGLYVTLAKIKK